MNKKTESPKPSAVGSNLSAGLDRRICPGCGTENPASADSAAGWFECSKCRWEWDGPRLPTVAELMKRRNALGDVHLGKFLRTLFKAV